MFGLVCMMGVPDVWLGSFDVHTSDVWQASYDGLS